MKLLSQLGWISLVCLLACAQDTTIQEQQILNKSVGKTPIMGWSSWNHFHTNIDQRLIKETAEAMVSSGMADAGYQYVNIDDGYFGFRDRQNRLHAHEHKFPDGMKAISDYIHELGLKAGIYSEAGRHTCATKWDNDDHGFFAGMYGYEEQDMSLMLNEWGYDFIKVDYCDGFWKKMDEKKRYTAISEAITKTNKEVVFNVCRWTFPGTWVKGLADSWRISADIKPTFESICSIIDTAAYLAQYAEPGNFNDMDMLQVGRGMTYEEDKAHFSMWCIMASPLLSGNDLRKMSQKTIDILTNEEVIAINQDVAGIQAQKVYDQGDLELWVKPLGGRQSPTRAIAMFNRSDKPHTMTVTWQQAGIAGKAMVRDLWDHTDRGVFENEYTALVPSHGIVLVQVDAENSTVPSSYEAEYAYMNLYHVTDMADYVLNENASGGAVAVAVGGHEDNWIEWQHVYVPNDGNYMVELELIGQVEVAIEVVVNEGDAQILKTKKPPAMQVYLKKGYNKIRINNKEEVLPPIDKINILKQQV
ncbi:alpha-galactosidase [Reichenbachiella carrageenanivorans]|uniref:Alpha-galactosidase n=1 Tax=Reichenbachiella carrageenanivorans TaxID=2979869 RepID=A0ABY6D498_9BACT|nr:alpha-galactosidase [Reichenbachiella carrageenanivorans]UXX80984.1 alpha-galactosidase [Reichenbachiella carrageenanivorans]